MLRIWSESHLVVVSEDTEFVGILAGLLDPLHRLQIFDSVTLESASGQDFSSALIVWDLDSSPSGRLDSFLKMNPHILRSCSLLLVGGEHQTQQFSQLSQAGAVDFLMKPVRREELRTRLDLARRPWVKAMRTTFEFIEALNAEFTITEQKILLVFLASPNFSASRAQINSELWNSANVNSNSLDVHLFNIRRKIEKTGLQIRFDNKKGVWLLLPSNSDVAQSPRMHTRRTT